jgi:hypothetical protein
MMNRRALGYWAPLSRAKAGVTAEYVERPCLAADLLVQKRSGAKKHGRRLPA